MAKKKITRKQLLKEPDEFLTLSGKAFNYARTHVKQLEYLGIALGALVLLFLGGYTYYRYINKKGQETYNKAYEVFKNDFKPEMNLANLKKSAALFKKVADRYSLSKAARLALPEQAYIKFLNKDYDGAISLYRRFLDKVSGNERYEALARLALAACYEQKGELQTAIVTLKPILTEKGNPFGEPALFHMARLYRLNHQPTEGKKAAKEFMKTYKNSPFLPVIKAFL
ncbi:MAG: tetratricopeptide repeat protein [Deltaproteobacteria bacterium]|nr:tetratricopeptide repeat protein [Deltaproteobacteria bacterium]